MKIGNIVRRANALSLALVLSTSTVLSMLVPGIAHATGAPYNCTWTGGGDDTSFSDAANWGTSCNNAAPVPSDNDMLIFDNTGLSAPAPHNDLTSASFSSIAFTGSDTDAFDIDGNSFTLTGGITNSSDGFPEIENNIVISGAQAINLTTGNVDLSGNLSGSGDLTLSGPQSLYLDGDNSTYSGNITISAGELFDQSATALGTTVGVTTVASGGALIFNTSVGKIGDNATIAEPLNLSGSGLGSGFANYALGVFNCHSNPCPGGTLTLSGNVVLNAATTVEPGGARSSQIKLTGGLSGSHTIGVAQGNYGDLVVASSANTSSTANGTYEAPQVATTLTDTDNTPVSVEFNETTTIDGTESSVYVDDGGVLKGTGTVADLTVVKGGTVAPGHSPGCLNTGDLNVTGTYQAEIGGTTACTGYDQLNVTGTVTLTDGGSPAVLPTLTTTLYNGFKPTAGDTYTIIKNDGADAVTGTFDGLAEGATFNLSGYVFSISYKGGDGNDVVLTVKSVPATPDTGFAFIGANPIATLLGTTVAAAAILAIAQRNRKAAVTVRARR